MKKLIFLILIVTTFIGCNVTNKPSQVLEAVVYTESENKNIDYLSEIKPILDKRCVVCHSCYNSPCQLKLSSYEGLDRGATKVLVYQTRLKAGDPTRLFMDAQTTDEWRQKEFYSVTDTNASENGSLAMLMLNQKIIQPKSEGFYLSETDLTCAETKAELVKFFEDNPHKGMPFGFPKLEREEYNLLMSWLAQGAKGSTPIAKPVDSNVEKWEAFLNDTAVKNQVMSRYIYEHLFIGHVYFPTNINRFYELVRSKTPPNEPIDIIATRYPFDSPETEHVYYRLREITSTIVDKTHILYEFSDEKMQRYESLFLKPEWNEKPYMPSYEVDKSANPFLTFAQIPTLSRYEFLLDDAYYMMSTFIKGPVCNGQVALDVIHDHLWVMFLDPKYDLSVTNPEILKNSIENLVLPNQEGSGANLSKILKSGHYSKKATKYYKYRDSEYSEAYKDGLSLDFLWKDTKNNSSLLTVYRHFDSGSLHKGALGDLPRTLWVVDYPLLERIYYSLVAGFDVFGTVSHEMLIRQYMNRLRIEGESNFLDFLPAEIRKETFNSWYLGTVSETVTKYHDSNIKSAIEFKTENYKEEFTLKALEKFGVQKDKINYVKDMALGDDALKNIKTKEDIERAFSYLTQNKVSTSILAYDIKYINLAHIRIRMDNQEDLMYSMVVNRWHDNVTFMFNEESRLDVKKDKLNFIEGFVGSYPNIYIDLSQDEISDFFTLLSNFDKKDEEYTKALKKFTVNRTNKDFWQVYDWFQNRYYDSDKLNSGLFDLNRYYPLAD